MIYRVRRCGSFDGEPTFVVDNGTELLATCGCCGGVFTEDAAKATAKKLNDGRLNWHVEMALAAEWEAHEIPEPPKLS
jgi:hypothetical protein